MNRDELGVVGAGQMGTGIAQVAAAAGFRVVLSDLDPSRAILGVERIASFTGRLTAKGKLTEAEREALLARITPTAGVEPLRESSLAIEAVTESFDLKSEIFAGLARHLSPSALLASNTSSISITKLASRVSHPERVVGIHFMNPVPVMPLVEIVRGLQTSTQTIEEAQAFAQRLGKEVVESKDRPGFIVNRMLVPFLVEACFALEEGLASAEDIDRAAQLGLNHRLGPLELSDLIGLDTLLAIAEVLHRELGDDKYRPPVLLRNLVAAGWLGRKTGRGFYRYDEQGKKTGRGDR